MRKQYHRKERRKRGYERDKRKDEIKDFRSILLTDHALDLKRHIYSVRQNLSVWW